MRLTTESLPPDALRLVRWGQLEGFTTGQAICKPCSRAWLVLSETPDVTAHLECPSCRRAESHFIQFVSVIGSE